MCAKTATAVKPINVVLCWHMHQPHYEVKGHYRLPWTYLHATKDYIDMANILAEVPKAKAVVNFAPILIEQLGDYAAQLKRFFEGGPAPGDPLLAALVSKELTLSNSEREAILEACLKANEERLVKRYPEYSKLVNIARNLEPVAQHIQYVSDRYLYDLLTWYHLAWMGETIKPQDKTIAAMLEKGCDFSFSERIELANTIHRVIESVIPAYRKLAEQGKAELATSPYAHPIVPLLLDVNSALEAMPDAPMPEMIDYPGGRERAQWHIDKGLAVFKQHFGFTPAGCWPSEGAVSQATLELLQENGFQWAATGESVLHHSLSHEEKEHLGCKHRPYQLKNNPIRLFFRDDGLSDLIGFTYSDWHADDAVSNLIHHIENIAEGCDMDQDKAVVSIILDGENAWEYYPENGFHFLTALYQRLSEHPAINLTTFSDYLAQHSEATPLRKLVAGSWVYGTFSTWIGDKDKNRGWDILGDAKLAYDEYVAHAKLNESEREALDRQLSICEGSDWFWWFGDYNPSTSVSDFDQLYRAQLKLLYEMMDKAPPLYLEQVISIGGGSPAAGGVMRQGKAS